MRSQKQTKRQKRTAVTSRRLLPLVRTVPLGGSMFPPEIDTQLTFYSQHELTSGTAPYFAYPFITNAPYDADPAFGSTATQGLVEMAAIYKRMRVTSYTTEISMHNQSPWSADVYIQHTNTLNGVSSGGSNTDLTSTATNPNCTTRLLPSVYAGGMTFRNTKTIAQIVGSPAPATDDQWASQTNSVPIQATYLLIGCKTRNPAATFTDPIIFSVTIRFNTKFYDRKMLSA